jgi:hypothetical protein
VEFPVIENSETCGNAGLGIHLGTGAYRATVQNYRTYNNRLDGLYLCSPVQFGTLAANVAGR